MWRQTFASTMNTATLTKATKMAQVKLEIGECSTTRREATVAKLRANDIGYAH